MAKRPSTLVGLEIEPSAVHVATVNTNGRLAVERSAVAALEPGVVRDGEVVDVEALAEALRAIWRDNKGLDRRVRIGIANQKIVVRVVELPPIKDEKELEQAVRFVAQDEIPMPLDGAVLDFHPLDLVETPAGTRQRVVLVAARRDMVDKILAAARSAGLRPEGIDLAAFAMVRALHRPGNDGETILYLSIGGLTNLAVATGSTCSFTRVVGGGLEAMAVELAERRSSTTDEARALLVAVGCETPLDEVDAELDAAMDARHVLLDGIRRIAGEVRNSVDFHQLQGAESPPIASCIMTGPAVAIDGFAAALGAELGIPVEAAAVEVAGGDWEGGSLTVAAGLAVEEAVR